MVTQNVLTDKKANSLFIGTREDFHKYFSGYARNKVQTITNSYKQKIGRCEHCGLTKSQLKSKGINLESAHVKGKERKDLINGILNKFKENDYFKVELEKFEEFFISSHHPIEDVILILCRQCHNKYDDKPKQENNQNLIANTNSKKIKKENTFSKELKIAQYIKSVFKEFFEKSMLSDSEIERLKDVSYSKKTFKLKSNGLSILRDINQGTDIKSKTGSSYKRYWTDIFDGKYYVCSQWYENENDKRQRECFKKWEVKIRNEGSMN